MQQSVSPFVSPFAKKVLLSAFCVLAVFQTQNSQAQEAADTTIGGVVGAGVGALAGRAIGGNDTATIVGAIVGGGLGLLVGHNIGKTEKEQMEISRLQALDEDQQQQWQSENSSITITTKIVREGYYYQSPQTVCRSYVSYININGEHSVENGQACHQEGGWIAVKPTEVIYQSTSYVSSAEVPAGPRRVVCKSPYPGVFRILDSVTGDTVGAYHYYDVESCELAAQKQRGGLVCLAGYYPGSAIVYDLGSDTYLGQTRKSLRDCIRSLPN
jgi:outer membrane lipoprotein SlyB